MGQPESKLSYNIMQALRAEGAFVWKNHGGPLTKSGLPDITGVYRGLFIGLETKMPGNESSTIQKLRHVQIRAAGGLVCVPHSVAEAMEWFRGVVVPAARDRASTGN